MAQPVFHILDRPAWEAFRRSGQYAPESLNLEGFIHCSLAEQVAETANRFYAGRDNLVLLEIDPAGLGNALIFEPAADHPGDFPHIYQPLKLPSVVTAHDFSPGKGGRFHWPAEADRG